MLSVKYGVVLSVFYISRIVEAWRFGFIYHHVKWYFVFSLFFNICFSCVYGCFVSVCALRVFRKACGVEEGGRSPGTEVTGAWELLGENWVSNMSSGRGSQPLSHLSRQPSSHLSSILNNHNNKKNILSLTAAINLQAQG